MRRRHVAIVSGTTLAANNGSSRVEEALCEEFARDLDVTLLTRDRAPLSGRVFRHETYQRPSSKNAKVWFLAHRVAARIQDIHTRQPIDIVHGFGFFPVALYVRRFCARNVGTRAVLTHHDMRLLPRSFLLRHATLSALRCADAITCLNHEQERRLRLAGVSPLTMSVISNGVSIGDPSADTFSERASPYFLFAGRLERAKGIHLLLDAYASLSADARPRLVVCGDGSDKTLVETRARELGVVHLGWQSHDALMRLVQGALAILLPSESEGSSLLVLEAFLRQTPVVIHDLPEIRTDVFDADGPLVELISVGDRDAWAEVLRRGKAQVDASMASRARTRALSRSWTHVADRYREVYERVLART